MSIQHEEFYKLKAENEQLWKQLEAAQADARRYQWLRAGGPYEYRWAKLSYAVSADEADQRIDAAIEDQLFDRVMTPREAQSLRNAMANRPVAAPSNLRPNRQG